MQLINPDFTELLQVLASSFKTKVEKNFFQINAKYGKGFCRAEKLPSGITVIISDTSLHETIEVERLASEDYSFCLQLNEEFSPDPEGTVKTRRTHEEFNSVVKLSRAMFCETYNFPAKKRLRTVKFFFNKDHLSSLLGKQAVEDVLSQYFPAVLNNEQQEPIATEYRIMLDDLWAESIDVPLRINYIQNRVLLLLEKYIIKLYERRELHGKKIKRTGDETTRLTQVEALLVKNFSVAPPTIDNLSRVAAMSPTKLKNDFKQLYGIPIYQYYQKNRMQKAKSLLVLGKYTITEVGNMVGYINLSHFAGAFKKEFGYLPSEMASKDGMLVYSR